jgi:hypothetical protein
MMRQALATAISMLLCVSIAQANDTAKSSDGRYSVSVVQLGQGDENGSGAQALILYNTNSNIQRRLLTSRWNGDYSRNLASLSKPMFSLDSGYVYFNTTDASPNSGYVHQFDLKMNVIKAVCPGWGLRVMRTGPYRGYLLVQTHRYYEPPRVGSYNPVYLVHPSGKKIMMVPGSDNDDGELAIDPWLAKMNWRAW